MPVIRAGTGSADEAPWGRGMVGSTIWLGQTRLGQLGEAVGLPHWDSEMSPVLLLVVVGPVVAEVVEPVAVALPVPVVHLVPHNTGGNSGA